MSASVLNKQTPSFEELLDFVSDIMSEFTSMRVFDALHFFIYQRCLSTISSTLNKGDRLKFFSSLLQLNYIDETMKYLQDENFLDTTAPGFTTPLVRDMLSLLCDGSHYSSDFAMRLTELNILNIFTDFLQSIQYVQNANTRFITKIVILTLHNIARREGAKKYFTSSNTTEAVLSTKSMGKKTWFISQLLLLLIEAGFIAEKWVLEKLLLAVKGEDKELSEWQYSELLQGLSKFTEQDQYLNQIIPCLPDLKEILKHDDIEEHIFTTKCFKDLSRNPEACKKMIGDETLISDLFNKSLSMDNRSISANVHSIRWRTGRATGRLPPKAEFLVSDEFPTEFKIIPTPLAQGGFGSVHFVIDINQPDDVQFVAKKTLRKLSGTDKCMETFQKEASILISLKQERIVQFHGFQKTETELLLFLEFVKMGTLTAFVKQHTRLNEALTRQFTIQILEGVKYLHENKIVHLDIKGNNILMADEANIKLTDFGLSTILNEEEGVEAEKGTTRYMAPEMINCPEGRIFKYEISLDIWSVGSTVVEMVTGVPPNSTTASVNVIFKRANLEKPKYNLPVESSIYLQQFLEKTFRLEAAERPSAETLLKEDAFVTGCI
ncbi:uncharacterized protein LOC131930109 [Physella acuta]|nr:uncharacterized protein LOC131930109 [Physella acuta]